MIAFGTILGHGLCTFGAVMGGRYLSTKISVKHSASSSDIRECLNADSRSSLLDRSRGVPGLCGTLRIRGLVLQSRGRDNLAITVIACRNRLLVMKVSCITIDCTVAS